jgi:hypothetical protein
MAKLSSARAMADSLRAALARHPEQLSAAAAAFAAVLASVLTLRLVRDHVAELVVVALALWFARPLLARLRSPLSAEAAADGTHLEEVSMDVTKAAFKAAFAAAQVQGDAAEQGIVEEFDLVPSAPPAAGPAAVVVVPLDAAVSRYDENYSCAVLWAVLTAAELTLCLEAHGDGSLGPLQQAENSTLTVTSAAGAVEERAALKVAMHPTNDENTVRCLLHFPSVSRGDSLAFKFGDPLGGYGAAQLCCLDDAFIAEHGLIML